MIPVPSAVGSALGASPLPHDNHSSASAARDRAAGADRGSAMGRIQVIRDGAFRHDPALTAAVAAIAAASFHDETGRLDRELARCDTVYLSRDEHDEVACLFLVAWETLDVNGDTRPALYTGLSAARPDRKGTGATVRLYKRCVGDAREWERRHRQRLTVWGSTATPSVFFAAQRLFAGTQPDEAGNYTEDAARVARAIARRLGLCPAPGAHPFVFSGAAAGVRYTDDERRRIAAVCRAKRFTLFEQLGVDETRGDRLLFVTAIPPTAPGLPPEPIPEDDRERVRHEQPEPGAGPAVVRGGVEPAPGRDDRRATDPGERRAPGGR